MRTTLDCIPCLLGLALRTARQATDDVDLHEQVVRDAAEAVRAIDLQSAPPVMAAPIFAAICQRVGVADPLRAIRERDNQLAQEIVGELRRRIERAADPLGAALRVSAAGNAIDFAACGQTGAGDLRRAIDEAMAAPLEDDIARFRDAIAGAQDLLWLADNAGEIVLDRLLIERLPMRRITVAVRGAPALNDALLSDAQFAGLTELCEVIDNGSAIPGTVLEDCSEAFVKRFSAAELILAKGQGNYETLGGIAAPVMFLLKIKCPVVATQLQRELGSIALIGPEETDR
ncbi:MAG: DUF89 family protein [Deltaproteobacteria bacterium]|jgi:uncharacterized protein with ATP-grasp and redox domains|nr:DUF89 family protein [Deltaproteobacteria bacterium]MBW2533593.1 DUF89 family protein [Deltaproteobacteria bacterium]